MVITTADASLTALEESPGFTPRAWLLQVGDAPADPEACQPI